MRATWFLFPVIALAAAQAATVATLPPLSGDEILEHMAKAGEKREKALQRYSGTREYLLKNDRFDREAAMIVQVTVEPEQGKQFRVLSSTGSETVQKNVFKKLLEAELDAGRQGKAELTKQNYNAILTGSDTINGRTTYVLELKPKQKSKYLIEGKAWVDAADFQVVRLEGRPAASLSFWTGRPYITCEFQKVSGVWMVARTRSLAKSKLLGSTELIIDFKKYDVSANGLVAQQIR